MKQINEKIKLSREEILSQYFMAYQPDCDVILTRYQQINMDKSIAEIDASEVVNRYSYYIDTFLGGNCSNSNNLYLDAVETLFLSGGKYTTENLTKLNIGLDFDKIPDINLSNNDFGEYNYTWNLEDFLFRIYTNVYSYVWPQFYHELEEANAKDEEEYIASGVFYGDNAKNVHSKVEKIIKQIMKKMIPNIQNTNIKILINFSDQWLNYLKDLLEEVLKSGYFDGCYIKAEDCHEDFSERMGLSKNGFEYYQYQQNVQCKRKIKNL